MADKSCASALTFSLV